MNKYNMVYNDLYSKITNHVFSNGEKLPSEAQLCAQYHVSRQTVRLALEQLRDSGFIKKVQGSGSFISYSPAKPQTKQIAVAVNNFQEYVFPSILSKLEDTLFQNNYVAVLVSTLGKVDKERQILQHFCDNPVDGIILQPEYSTLNCPNLDLIRQLQSNGTKFLFMDSRYPDPHLENIPCVSMDNYSTTYDITRELIKTKHTYIGGLFRLRSAQILKRFNGARQAIVDSRIAYQEDAWVLAEDLRSLKKLLDDSAFQSFQQIDAVICGTGEYAFYLFDMLQKHGHGNIRTVVIFDEVEAPDIPEVSFINVKYAGEKIGRLCAEKILNLVQGGQESSVNVPWVITYQSAGHV